MIRQIRFVGLLMLLTVLACRAPVPGARTMTVTDGDSFTLAEGESATLEGNGAQLRFVEVVDDSRCPIEADCVDAGEVTVRVRLIEDNSSFSLDLTLRPGDEYASADGQFVTVLLRAVEPYPSIDNPPDGPYTATFSLLGPDCCLPLPDAGDQSQSPPAGSQPVTAQVGDTFDLVEGGVATLGDTGVEFTFVRVIDDYRCPTSVDCAEAGGMSIRVEMSRDGQSESFDLDYHLGMDYLVAELGDAYVQFIDLNPYPEDFDPPTDPYVATFVYLDRPALDVIESRPDNAFDMTVGDSVTLGGSGVRMSFVDVIEDARCPVDYECETAGWVVLRIELSTDNESESFDLTYWMDDIYPSVEWQGVTIQYVALVPYPESTDPFTEVYTATFTVTYSDEGG